MLMERLFRDVGIENVVAAGEGDPTGGGRSVVLRTSWAAWEEDSAEAPGGGSNGKAEGPPEPSRLAVFSSGRSWQPANASDTSNSAEGSLDMPGATGERAAMIA